MKPHTREMSRRMGMRAALAALALVIGFMDFRSGPHVSILIVYLVPVVLATRLLSVRDGVGYSMLAGTVWLFANGMATGATTVLLWNGLVRTAIFLFFVYVIYLQNRLRDLLKLEKELRRTDQLTGILNRGGFMDDSVRIADICARHGRHLSLAFIDLDGFKAVNDTRGHQEGDELLKVFTSILKANLRASDILARFGGDEFVVLFPETPIASASAALGKILHLFSKVAGERGWPVSFSAGIVACRGPGFTVESLLVLADRQLYMAKNTGKNQILGRELVQGEPAVPEHRP